VPVAKRTGRISASQVKKILASYAERGVFRSFSQVPGEKGKAEFRFNWLWNLPFHLTFDPVTATLSFRKLLPGIPRGTQFETELKQFIGDFSEAARPDHRRIDPVRLSLRYSNQRGTVALTFRILEREYEYGVRKAVNVVNEIFLSFLNVRFPEYMAAKFKLPEE
jgi:hypothetical protein